MVDNDYEEPGTEAGQTSLALEGRVSSSSVGYGGAPGCAVDGNTEANFYR